MYVQTSIYTWSAIFNRFFIYICQTNPQYVPAAHVALHPRLPTRKRWTGLASSSSHPGATPAPNRTAGAMQELGRHGSFTTNLLSMPRILAVSEAGRGAQQNHDLLVQYVPSFKHNGISTKDTIWVGVDHQSVFQSLPYNIHHFLQIFTDVYPSVPGSFPANPQFSILLEAYLLGKVQLDARFWGIGPQLLQMRHMGIQEEDKPPPCQQLLGQRRGTTAANCRNLTDGLWNWSYWSPRILKMPCDGWHQVRWMLGINGNARMCWF